MTSYVCMRVWIDDDFWFFWFFILLKKGLNYCILSSSCQSYVGCLQRLNRKRLAKTNSVSCRSSINAHKMYSSFSTCVCFPSRKITPAAHGIVMKTLKMTCQPWSLKLPFRPRCIRIDSSMHRPIRIMDSFVSAFGLYSKLTAFKIPMPKIIQIRQNKF